MGSEATKSLEARRREASSRVDRLIAEAEERSPIAAARRARINSATREGLRALKALGAAERARPDLQTRAGTALIRLIEEGLSCNEAYESLGLSRAVGRRLINLSASTLRATEGLSTTTRTCPASEAARSDVKTGASNHATAKGTL